MRTSQGNIYVKWAFHANFAANERESFAREIRYTNDEKSVMNYDSQRLSKKAKRKKNQRSNESKTKNERNETLVRLFFCFH